MRLKLTLLRPGEAPQDLSVTVDGAATVGDVAHHLGHGDPQRGELAGGAWTLRVHEREPHDLRVLPVDLTMSEAGLRSGATVSLAPPEQQFRSGGADGPAVATLVVLAGPDRGKEFPLREGVSYVGRDRSCQVRLSDPLVSKHHARLNIGHLVELVDTNSSNGVLVGGGLVPRAVLRPDDVAVLGDTSVAVRPLVPLRPGRDEPTGAAEFNRSPRLDPRYEGQEFVAPDPPDRPQRQRLPLIAMLAPLGLGAALLLMTRSVASIIFVAMTPLLMLGTYVENRRSSRRVHQEEVAQFRAALESLNTQLAQALDMESRGRRRESPGTSEVVDACHRLTPLLWTRRPEHRSFLSLRLGLGQQPSRNSVRLPSANRTTPRLWQELLDVQARHAALDQVPVLADLQQCGALGIAGPQPAVAGAARALVTQLVGLHSPAEVVLAALTSSSTCRAWDWLKWLPHSSSPHSPLTGHHLAAGPGSCLSVVAQLEDLVDSRANSRSTAPDGDRSALLPAVFLLVEDDAPVERSRLVQLAESGRDHGVYVLWLAATVAALPAACLVFLDLTDATGTAGVGYVHTGAWTAPVAVESLTEPEALSSARRLAPLTDSGARMDDDSDLPRAVSFVTLAGAELVRSPESIVERWSESNSLRPRDGAAIHRQQDNSLRAIVGQSATESFYLDLRTHGPHALVGGTTGAGKSEFLQSWILGMATAHSPERVTFLFVDYKGGSAFSECVNLPHSVGLVTDLSPHLVRRALTSLNAELRYREHLLNRNSAKDLLELERRGDVDCPPSLVIVVDEFAALVQEVPQFVDGVVNIAQRGRSLGLHLILATQRPAGVIKENLRANTNLRIALRMADEADSTDILGTALAANFDPSIPGRAAAKSGPGRLSSFQTAYVGGRTASGPSRPSISVEELTFGEGRTWQLDEGDPTPAPSDSGPKDIERLVRLAGEAAQRSGVQPPRRPWLPELAPVYDLSRLPSARTDRDLVLGVGDDAPNQSQPIVSFKPDSDGNMAVFGTGGAGKSATLRSIAISAAITPRGGPCQVYGIDFGAGGLQMLEELPHVGAVISGEDHERIARLLRGLRTLVEERANRYSALRVGTISEYREAAQAADEPRILLLVDGLSAFRQSYEFSDKAPLFAVFQQIAADGRQVGVHVVVTADRPGSVPSSLGSAIQQRLVLRLADEADYGLLGVPSDALGTGSPPGRGFLGGSEVQVALFGGDPNVAAQARAVSRLAESMRRMGVSPAPAVQRLPERIALSDLPISVADDPTLGMADETLAPVGVAAAGILLVTGPPASGRTTALATIAVSTARWQPELRLVHLSARRSPLSSLEMWTESASSPDEVADLADQLCLKLKDVGIQGTKHLVVIEHITEFLNGPAEMGLQELIRICRVHDHFVVAEGETSAMVQSWPLLQVVKAGRRGLALQPDQLDGDAVFRTSFPRVARSQFPPGRGLLVSGGKAVRVQVALPE